MCCKTPPDSVYMKASKIILLLAVAILCILSCSKPEEEPIPAKPEPAKPDPKPAEPEPVKSGWTIDTVQWKSTGTYARQIEKLPDGGYVISSDNQVGKINADGSTDMSFHVSAAADGVIMRLRVHGNKILVMGSFEKYEGKNMRGFVRLNPDGTLDEQFKIPFVAGSNPQDKSKKSYDVVVTPEGDYVFSGSELRVPTGITIPEGPNDYPTEVIAKGVIKVSGVDGHFIKTFGESLEGYWKAIGVDKYAYALRDVAAKSITMLSDGSMIVTSGAPAEYVGGGQMQVTFYNAGLLKITKEGQIDKTWKVSNLTRDAYHAGFWGVSNVYTMSDGRLLFVGDFQIVENTQKFINYGFLDPVTGVVTGERNTGTNSNPFPWIESAHIFDGHILLGQAHNDLAEGGAILPSMPLFKVATGERVQINTLMHPDFKDLLTPSIIATDPRPTFVKYFSQIYDFVEVSPTEFLMTGQFATSVTYYPNTNKYELKRARGILRMVKK